MNPREQPVRFSRLRHMSRSPAHYLASLTHRADTPAMRTGRLIHALVLGGDFLVYDGERRGKAWTEFDAANSGREIYTATEHDRASVVADAIRANRLAMDLLEGEAERHIHWTGLNGRACSSRLDVLAATHVTDLKTSFVTEPGQFTRSALRMGYHAQLAFYLDAAAAIGSPRKEAFIVAVETSPPYAIVTLRLTQRALDEGRKLCRIWMERLLGCEESNYWPGYVESTIDLDVPDDLELSFGEEDAA